MLGGSQDQTDSMQRLVDEVKKHGFSQNLKNFLNRMAFQESSSLRFR